MFVPFSQKNGFVMVDQIYRKLQYREKFLETFKVCLNSHKYGFVFVD